MLQLIIFSHSQDLFKLLAYFIKQYVSVGIVGQLVENLPGVHEAPCCVFSITEDVVEADNPISMEKEGGIKSNSSSLNIEEFNINQFKTQWVHRIRTAPESPCHNCVM